MGFEAAGVVVELAARVKNLKVGDRITSLVSSGGYSEYATADATVAIPIPEGISFNEAATIPVQGLSACALLKLAAKPQASENGIIGTGSSRRWNCPTMSAAPSFDLPNRRPYRRNVGTRRAPNPTLELCPLSEMFNMRSGSRSVRRLLPGPLGVIRWRTTCRNSLQSIVLSKRWTELFGRRTKETRPS